MGVVGESDCVVVVAGIGRDLALSVRESTRGKLIILILGPDLELFVNAGPEEPPDWLALVGHGGAVEAASSEDLPVGGSISVSIKPSPPVDVALASVSVAPGNTPRLHSKEPERSIGIHDVEDTRRRVVLDPLDRALGVPVSAVLVHCVPPTVHVGV